MITVEELRETLKNVKIISTCKDELVYVLDYMCGQVDDDLYNHAGIVNTDTCYFLYFDFWNENSSPTVSISASRFAGWLASRCYKATDFTPLFEQYLYVNDDTLLERFKNGEVAIMTCDHIMLQTVLNALESIDVTFVTFNVLRDIASKELCQCVAFTSSAVYCYEKHEDMKKLSSMISVVSAEEFLRVLANQSIKLPVLKPGMIIKLADGRKLLTVSDGEGHLCFTQNFCMLPGDHSLSRRNGNLYLDDIVVDQIHYRNGSQKKCIYRS